MSKPNIYDCQVCKGKTITRHAEGAEEGVTPFMIRCKTTPGCNGEAHSRFYHVDPLIEPKATHEWFKPTGKDYDRLSPEMKDHVDRGGLDLRTIDREGPA